MFKMTFQHHDQANYKGDANHICPFFIISANRLSVEEDQRKTQRTMQ